MIERAARTLVLWTALALLVASPAQADPCRDPDRGMGGTGLSDERGLGGTGLSDERGMGGTGRSGDPGDDDDHGMGGTGIVGTVTGFASVCVNGLRIRYDAGTPVDRAGSAIPASALRVGQTVSLSATGAAPDLRADRISLLAAVSGPVTAVDAGRGRIEVMDQPVAVSAQTRGELAAHLASVAVGDRIEVHGHRDHAGGVVATRLDRAPAAAAVTLAGPARELRGGEWRIGSTRVSGRGDPRGFTRVVGRWDPADRRVVATRVDAVAPSARRFARASVEAYVENRDASNRVRTPVLAIDASRLPDVAARLDAGVRLWAAGVLQPDGTLVADRIEIDPVGGGAPFPAPDLWASPRDRPSCLAGSDRPPPRASWCASRSATPMRWAASAGAARAGSCAPTTTSSCARAASPSPCRSASTFPLARRWCARWPSRSSSCRAASPSTAGGCRSLAPR